VSDDALAALGLAMTRHQALVDEVRAFRDQRERAKTSGAGPSKLWFYRRFARLSYALADCDLQQMSVGSEMLRQYLNNPMLFDLATAAIRRTADRAGGYRVFLRGVDAERAKGEAGIEPLQLLLDQQRQAQHDWEAGHVGVVLAGVYERAARPAEAETILRDTISRLEHALPGEVQRRGLYAVLSRILRQQQKYGDALEQAKIGVLKDPVSTFERIELGSAYSDLAEYVSAQSAFEIASKINAEDPGAHFGLVSVHMQQVEDETTKAERKKRLERAAEQVAILLDLLAPTDSRRTTVHFTLARVHAWGGRYGAAIRELRALNRRKERDLAVELYLADAYLSCERWVDAEQQFRGVAHQVEGLMANAAGKGDEPVPSPLGEKMVLGSVEAFARLGIAATLVERHIYLDEALTEVTRARASVDALSDIDLKREWVASCNFWEGAILLQQDRLDKAVSSLEAAVAAKSDAASYFQLANALTRQAELAPSADRGLAVRRAMRYYDEAQRIDWTDELAPKVNQARTRALSLAGGSVAVAAP
jgi:tetratricopeptide (TPR) repeat protein